MRKKKVLEVFNVWWKKVQRAMSRLHARMCLHADCMHGYGDETKERARGLWRRKFSPGQAAFIIETTQPNDSLVDGKWID